MTGIPLFDAVHDFINFVRMIAGMGMFLCGALLVMGIVGSFASPYSRWGLFVGRYITGDYSLWGHNLMWVCGAGLLICLVIRVALAGFGAQTLPRFP